MITYSPEWLQANIKNSSVKKIFKVLSPRVQVSFVIRSSQ